MFPALKNNVAAGCKGRVTKELLKDAGLLKTSTVLSLEALPSPPTPPMCLPSNSDIAGTVEDIWKIAYFE